MLNGNLHMRHERDVRASEGTEKVETWKDYER
jgi:hypothetical protein